MKHLINAALLTGLLASQVGAADQIEFKDQKQKISYIFGLNLGNNWKNQDIEVDLDLLVKGIKDAAGGVRPAISETEIRTIMTGFQTEMRNKANEKRKVQGEKNKTEGAAFLAANKSKPGVTVTASGLQYKVLTEGKGESPKPTDTVTVNYRGTLIDGTEFDSSYSRNQPATFAVNGVIKGWTEALQLMKPGGKLQLTIPSELAYGEYGSGPKIGPSATLLFEVELVSIAPQPPKPGNEPVTSDIIKVPSADELKKGAKIEVIKKEDVDKLQKK